MVDKMSRSETDGGKSEYDVYLEERKLLIDAEREINTEEYRGVNSTEGSSPLLAFKEYRGVKSAFSFQALSRRFCCPPTFPL